MADTPWLHTSRGPLRPPCWEKAAPTPATPSTLAPTFLEPSQPLLLLRPQQPCSCWDGSLGWGSRLWKGLSLSLLFILFPAVLSQGCDSQSTPCAKALLPPSQLAERRLGATSPQRRPQKCPYLVRVGVLLLAFASTQAL